MKSCGPSRLAALGALTALTALTGMSGSCSAPKLGSVSQVLSGSQYCEVDRHPLDLPDTVCKRATVSCPNTTPVDVFLRISEAAPSSTPRGTIVFGLGGNGTSWYESTPSAEAALLQLQLDGFRIVQRAWDSGWFPQSSSLREASCRYATLITWLHAPAQQLVDPGTGFCATGNSGGSAEISYALAHWQRGSILDLAVPSGGPPLGVVDRGCLQPNGAFPDQYDDWIDECNTLVSAAGVCPQHAQKDCSYNVPQVGLVDSGFDLSGATPCADEDPVVLPRNNVLSPGATLVYPRTRVHFILGEDDCTSAVGLAMPFIESVQNLGQPAHLFGLSVEPNAPHGVHSTPAGMQAIYDSLTHPTEGCLDRH